MAKLRLSSLTQIYALLGFYNAASTYGVAGMDI